MKREKKMWWCVIHDRYHDNGPCLGARDPRFPPGAPKVGDIVDGAEVVDVYADAEAVADGVLVDLDAVGACVIFDGKPVNRMTRHLWDNFEPFLTAEVDAGLKSSVGKALEATMRTKLARAWYEGDTWHLYPRLWLVENETGGWTVLYPEDY